MVSADKTRVFRLGALLLASVPVLAGLCGCAPAAAESEVISTVSVSNTASVSSQQLSDISSTVSVVSDKNSTGSSTASTAPNTATPVSDPVLDLEDNPVFQTAGGSVEMTGGEPVIKQFFSRYADSMLTLEMYDYSGICADTIENALMIEFIRYRVAFMRTQDSQWISYNMNVKETLRENKDGVIHLQFAVTAVSNRNGYSRSGTQEYVWEFMLETSGNAMQITSTTIISTGYEDGFRLDILQKALKATGLPLETAQQIHAAGDAVIQYFYKNGTLPKGPVKLTADGSKSTEDYQKIALPYTDAYYLICGALTPEGLRYIGLVDKNGTMIFDLLYWNINVTKNGYFILNSIGNYIIVNPDGYEVARYDSLRFYTVDKSGNGVECDVYYYFIQPAAPYAAYIITEHCAKESWLLDENFQPLGGCYHTVTLTETGATADKDDTYYQLDKNGNVISYIAYLTTKNASVGIMRNYKGDSLVHFDDRDIGCWLVDKDGKRISEKYQQIGNAVDENGELYVNTEDTTSPLIFISEDGTRKTVPLSEVLIPMH